MAWAPTVTTQNDDSTSRGAYGLRGFQRSDSGSHAEFAVDRGPTVTLRRSGFRYGRVVYRRGG